MEEVDRRSTRLIDVRDEAELDALADLIHDCYFELDDVRWDREPGTVVIPYDREVRERGVPTGGFLWFRRVAVPTFRWYLTFSSVLDRRIVDEAQVGRYDFNTVAYDAERGTVTVRTNIPLEFELRVSELRVAVDATDEVVRTRTTVGLGRERRR